jgi:hypothetical protein
VWYSSRLWLLSKQVGAVEAVLRFFCSFLQSIITQPRAAARPESSSMLRSCIG